MGSQFIKIQIQIQIGIKLNTVKLYTSETFPQLDWGLLMGFKVVMKTSICKVITKSTWNWFLLIISVVFGCFSLGRHGLDFNLHL